MPASTPEAFDALVKKIEAIAQKNPSYYRRRLRLLACLGYGYIVLVFTLLLGGLVLIRQALLATQGVASTSQLNVIIVLIAAGFVSLFFAPVKKPAGVVLTRAQVPQLYAMLDELSVVLKAPKLDTVILDVELNAAIMQRPKFGIIGWHANYLLLGLPLMQVLSPEQFKAVVAHELAHLCGGDGRVAAWIYRVRKTWFELAERFEQNRQGGLFFRKFFSWYGPFFKAYSFVHARSQEYEADRRAAEIVDPKHKAEALIWLNLNASKLIKQFWPNFEQQSADLAEPPGDYISQLLSVLEKEIKPKEKLKWLALRLAEQSTNDSTHPCLRDRLDALGYKVSAELTSVEQRATVLLSQHLESLTQQLNQQWKKEHWQGWYLLRDRYRHRQQRLAELDNKSQTLLTIEERVKQVALHAVIGDNARISATVNSVLEQVPNHAAANYWLGWLLTEAEDTQLG
ncbi:MAG: M48 family metallopeptidase, partial [Cyanobacteria bacterium J06632_3]